MRMAVDVDFRNELIETCSFPLRTQCDAFALQARGCTRSSSARCLRRQHFERFAGQQSHRVSVALLRGPRQAKAGAETNGRLPRVPPARSCSAHAHGSVAAQPARNLERCMDHRASRQSDQPLLRADIHRVNRRAVSATFEVHARAGVPLAFRRLATSALDLVTRAARRAVRTQAACIVEADR